MFSFLCGFVSFIFLTQSNSGIFVASEIIFAISSD